MLQVLPGDLQPTAAALNGVACALQTAPPQAPPPAAAESVGSLGTQDGQIIGPDGKPLFLWGINYFGFEVGATMVDGLWAGAHPCGASLAEIKNGTNMVDGLCAGAPRGCMRLALTQCTRRVAAPVGYRTNSALRYAP